MEVKANVQRRRQDRIRELQARSREHIESGPPGVAGLPVRDDGRGGQTGGGTGNPEPPLWLKGPLEPDHGGDPELAWKHREKELLRWYSEGGNGEGGAGAGPGYPAGPAGTPAYGAPGAGRSDGTRGGGPTGRMLVVKTIAAAVIFAGAFAVVQLDTPWSAGAKSYLQTALTEDMDFGAVAAWYDRTFDGAPSFLPAFGSKTNATKVQAPAVLTRFIPPVKGQVKEAYSESKQGMWLETKKDAHVAAADDGRIEFTGDLPDTGHTLVIQHSDGYRMTYGGLQPTKWESGDWVKAGDVIGSAREDNGKGAVYVAVMKDQRYVNPMEVVAFD